MTTVREAFEEYMEARKALREAEIRILVSHRAANTLEKHEREILLTLELKCNQANIKYCGRAKNSNGERVAKNKEIWSCIESYVESRMEHWNMVSILKAQSDLCDAIDGLVAGTQS